MIVVIPSNRSIRLDYLTPLIDYGARFLIVDDSEGTISINHPQFDVYTWADRKKMLGPLDAWYPKRNGAARDFGFYVAWKNSDPGEIIVALDDDCQVYHHDFCLQVEQTLSYRERPIATCEGTHLNILDLYHGLSNALFPRGFPYSARVGYQALELQAAESRNVTFSLGLWKGVFDINAIDKIKASSYEYPNASLAVPSVIVERNRLVSVCAMNMQFRRELIPAAFQLPMQFPLMPEWVFDRYGDIWGGFILKTLMDLKNEAMAVGEPMIHHWKEGGYTDQIWREHAGHLMTDEFLDLLSQVKQTIHSSDYLGMMKETNEGFRRGVEKASPMLRTYLRHLCAALEAWNTSLS